jgi:phosphotransferase system  glucose/maltose/N-acetylglucosamine-specific IIC component
MKDKMERFSIGYCIAMILMGLITNGDINYYIFQIICLIICLSSIFTVGKIIIHFRLKKHRKEEQKKEIIKQWENNLRWNKHQ